MYSDYHYGNLAGGGRTLGRRAPIVTGSSSYMSGNNLDEQLEVPKEDELYLRNHWKLVAVSQFVDLFKNLFKFKDPLTPYDLE
jgi:hypothetical protein